MRRRRSFPGADRGAERGMVTLELALGLVAATFALLVAVTALWLAALQFGYQSAAGDIARQAVRGDSAAVRAVESRLPPEAQVSVVRGGSGVVVTVSQRLRPFGAGAPEIVLTGRAAAVWEPGEGGRG